MHIAKSTKLIYNDVLIKLTSENGLLFLLPNKFSLVAARNCDRRKLSSNFSLYKNVKDILQFSVLKAFIFCLKACFPSRNLENIYNVDLGQDVMKCLNCSGIIFLITSYRVSQLIGYQQVQSC